MGTTMSIKQFMLKPKTENQKWKEIDAIVDYWFMKGLRIGISILVVSLGLEIVTLYCLPIIIHAFMDVLSGIQDTLTPLK